MSSHDDHNDHHVSETKPVSFTVPLILGLVTMLVILLFVSLGDPCPCCSGCCEANSEMGSCEKNEHETAAEEAHEQHEAVAPAEEQHTVTPTENTEKSAEKSEKKEEAHH